MGNHNIRTVTEWVRQQHIGMKNGFLHDNLEKKTPHKLWHIEQNGKWRMKFQLSNEHLNNDVEVEHPEIIDEKPWCNFE